MDDARIEFEFGENTRKLAQRALDLWQAQLELGILMANGNTTVLAALQAEVANNTTIEGSVQTLIGNMAAVAAAAAPGNAALATALGTLTANDANLAALVVANTPVASPNPVIPPPAPPPVVAQAIAALPAAAATVPSAVVAALNRPAAQAQAGQQAAASAGLKKPV